MILQYLGTGPAEGFPAIFCTCPTCERARLTGGKNLKTRSSALIDGDILIDISPDLLSQMNVHGMSPVSSVLITHSHPDHLDMNTLWIRCQKSWCRETAPLSIFASHDVITKIERELKGTRWDGQLLLTPILPYSRYQIGGISVYPILANHMPDEECYIFVLQNPSGCILYGNDTGYIGEDILSGNFIYDVVSLDCANGVLPSDGHMGLSDIRKMVAILRRHKRIHDGTRIVLNHFGHQSGMTHDEFQNLIDGYGYQLSYDGLLLDTTCL